VQGGKQFKVPGDNGEPAAAAHRVVGAVAAFYKCLCVQEGKQFEVLVADARPGHTGEPAAAALLRAGVPTSYLPLHAVSAAAKRCTKVMLGCEAVKSNGAVVARAGSALVAMAARADRKPVLICAQSAKFHDSVQLDSITSNEQADPRVRLFCILSCSQVESQPCSRGDQSSARRDATSCVSAQARTCRCLACNKAHAQLTTSPRATSCMTRGRSTSLRAS
jgi:translation initiation factor 2B subunit (eIF-2B alpha/beta/delta family)